MALVASVVESPTIDIFCGEITLDPTFKTAATALWIPWERSGRVVRDLALDRILPFFYLENTAILQLLFPFYLETTFRNKKLI